MSIFHHPAKEFGSIGVVIVNWNSWDILSHCLEKLQSQTFHNFNVLVIDNASDQPVPNGFLSRYPNVTLAQNQSDTNGVRLDSEFIRKSDWPKSPLGTESLVKKHLPRT